MRVNAHVPSRTKMNRMELLPPEDRETVWKNLTSVKTNRNVSNASDDSLARLSDPDDKVYVQS